MAWKRVMSLLAAAADMCRLGCLRVEAASTALAKVPTDLLSTRNWSMALSPSACSGLHTSSSSSSSRRAYVSPGFSIASTLGTSAW